MFSFERLVQKGSEIFCDELIAQCPNLFLDRLACLFENTPSIDCEAIQFASKACYYGLQECPKVWLKQYALPITIAAAGIVAVATLCRPRR